jgi:hypothetical protein
LLLEATAVQDLETQKRLTQEYKDLWSWQHGFATEAFLRYYNFDGTRCRITDGYDSRYVLPGEDADRNPRSSDKPKITRIRCR